MTLGYQRSATVSDYNARVDYRDFHSLPIRLLLRFPVNITSYIVNESRLVIARLMERAAEMQKWKAKENQELEDYHNSTNVTFVN